MSADNSIKITVIDRDGNEHLLDAPTDMNLNIMELCKSYDLPIDGTCGGMAMCASCQVYIVTDHVSLERTDDEQAMLDEAWHVEDNSRLGCQISINEKMDGLILKIAPEVNEENDW